jgi:hypothetical protein
LVVVRRYLSLMIWICWFLFVGMRAIVARCVPAMLAIHKRMRRSMLLYCTQIDGWIERNSKRRRVWPA